MSLPLETVRVVDLADGPSASAGRLLADLGAEVVRVVRSDTAHSNEEDRDGPIADALRSANKQRLVLDPNSDAETVSRLIAGADIVLASDGPGAADCWGLDIATARADAPHLVWVSITPFGQTGPYRRRVADENVLYAMSGVLSRSGAPGEVPLLPPAGLAEGTVAAHAAWAALLAYRRRLETGVGDTVDVSAFEALVHGFDPGFGTQGSAAAGRSEDYPRNRPAAADFYPVFGCRDGRVRICLLAKRQWRAMFDWLGGPPEFADPSFDTIPARFAAADRLHPLIAALFADRTQDELVDEGARRGIPVGAVYTLGQALTVDHFTESGALLDAELFPGVRARVPAGHTSFAGRRAGFRMSERTIDALPQWDAPRPLETPALETPALEGTGDRTAAPLAGVRVLDLGVIVFGAELSRQLADYGADVIKIENADYPDGLRQSKRGAKIPASIAWGHRNKRSLGLDLRSPEGAQFFRRLAADADVVVANFKPGTLANMGMSYEALAEINPTIIVAEASAFGATGPWRTRMGYGPLVRAASGVSALWSYPDDELLCDGSTVYPDHVAGHLCATAVLSALIARRRTGRGTSIALAQSDVALSHIGASLATESLTPGSTSPTGNAHPRHAPSGVFACAGDDEWCVATVRGDDEWVAVCSLVDRPDLATDERFATAAARLTNRAAADDVLAQWAVTRTPAQAAAELQEVGVAAGPMLRLPELLEDQHLRARETFTTVTHDLLPAALPATARAAVFGAVGDPPSRQAPLAGEHTREICTDLLGMADAEYDRLVHTGVLQPAP
ncbi:CoA transferase [Gordonia sp. HY002]|uniref:CaiB/BaiF CoA-transferase family protein n=1 Tax=Gordonia zhenghanii TaxID=2911516 RepID=UPI001EF04FA6|nr:CoA transferase [Gordonia zhenghanii]MCF8571315.1 CoA transferase [Gordonia zhenghanii]MCF8601839.1 CoA transferase [Gordonia zhenghanii]